MCFRHPSGPLFHFQVWIKLVLMNSVYAWDTILQNIGLTYRHYITVTYRISCETPTSHSFIEDDGYYSDSGCFQTPG